MASIRNPELTIGVLDSEDRAGVSVTCDLEFTEFEVKAMNLLGLRYSLHCRLFNKDLWDVEPVASFDDQTIPGATEVMLPALRHVVFDMVRPASELHTHVFSRDQLEAELTLENAETGEQTITHTALVPIDLEP